MLPLAAATLLLALAPPPAVASSLCDTKAYQKASLVHLASQKLGSIFPDAAGMKQFEASGVALNPEDGRAAIIFDNAHTIGLLDAGSLLPFEPRGTLLGVRRPNQSQHEGVAWKWDAGGEAATVLALVEAAVDPSDGQTRARIDEYRVPKLGAWKRSRGVLRRLADGWRTHDTSNATPNPAFRKCWIQGLTFSHDNKGLEDIVYLGAGRALAVCEGNYCSGGARGRTPGHGRLVALTFQPAAGDVPCAWNVDRMISLPSDAAFEDYAGLTLRSGVLAVLSQSDAAVWIGAFNATTLEFGPAPSRRSRVYALPRDANCRRTFCNAEGIDFMDDPTDRGPARLVITTDKARFGSPWPCVRGAESVAVLGLLRGAVKQDDPW
jgi:hypothetical protein